MNAIVSNYKSKSIEADTSAAGWVLGSGTTVLLNLRQPSMMSSYNIDAPLVVLARFNLLLSSDMGFARLHSHYPHFIPNLENMSQ